MQVEWGWVITLVVQAGIRLREQDGGRALRRVVSWEIYGTVLGPTEHTLILLRLPINPAIDRAVEDQEGVLVLHLQARDRSESELILSFLGERMNYASSRELELNQG